MRKECIHSLFDEVGIDEILAIVKKERDVGSMDPHITDVSATFITKMSTLRSKKMINV